MATSASSCSTRRTGKFKRMWGAFGNAPRNARGKPRHAAAADDAGRSAGIRAAACHQGLPRWRRLRRRSHQQPDSAVHTRRKVRQAGARQQRR
jgi:hypothetical protein